MDLELKCSSVSVSHTYSHKQVLAVIEDINQAEVLESFKIEDIIYHIGEEKFLDIIGEDRVIKYFGIELKEEE